MKKNLRKNKKGFTLVEIIVVLLIIGILLAITIPSIMGYVGKAKDAQIKAEARSGYVAAQTIVAQTVAANPDDQAFGLVNEATDSGNTVTAATVSDELNDEDGTITAAGCSYSGKKITKCAFTTEVGGDSKVVLFNPDKTAEEPTKIVATNDAELTDINLK